MQVQRKERKIRGGKAPAAPPQGRAHLVAARPLSPNHEWLPARFVQHTSFWHELGQRVA